MKTIMKTIMKASPLTGIGVSLCTALLLSGCVSTVAPWERGNLAKAEMQFEPDAMQGAFKRHVYSSKEASSGGTATAGGGCGCN